MVNFVPLYRNIERGIFFFLFKLYTEYEVRIREAIDKTNYEVRVHQCNERDVLLPKDSISRVWKLKVKPLEAKTSDRSS